MASTASEPRHRVIEARIHAFRNATHMLVYAVSDVGAPNSSSSNSTAANSSAATAATDPAIIACALANAREQLLQLKLALVDGVGASDTGAHFDPHLRKFVVVDEAQQR